MVDGRSGPSPGGSPGSDNERQRLQLLSLAGVGYEFAASIGLGALLGWLTDRWLGTRPWCILIGTGIGFVAGIYRLFRVAMRNFNR